VAAAKLKPGDGFRGRSFAPRTPIGEKAATRHSPRPKHDPVKQEPVCRNDHSDKTEIRFMTDAPDISPLDQARILSEALPHMQ